MDLRHSPVPGVGWIGQPPALLTYAADAGLQSGRPDAVAFPRSEDDVVRLVEWARQQGLALIPWGAGTGTSGGAVAEQGGLVLAFGRMQRVELDEAQRSALVEPGLVNAELDRLARERGLFYPPDPASGRVCTLGGNIAENAGGPRCFKYGVTANYVTGLWAVLADGRRVQFGGAALDCPEYDWLGVLTGSEGTLAAITAARLRLLRQPAASALLMAAFDTVEAAGDAVSAVIARGLTPATIEMMDQIIVQMIESYAHLGLPVDAGALLIVEVDGYRAAVEPQLAALAGTLAEHGARDLVEAHTPAERDRIWNARKGSAGALARLAPAYYPSDCTVPRSQIARALHEINAIMAEAGLRVCYLLHAGDGNLHPNILIDDPDDPVLMERVLAAEGRALEVCLGLGGSITGEHGVGSERRGFMSLMYGPAELGAMQDIKAVFDPQHLLNPGKIFPAPAAGPGTSARAAGQSPGSAALLQAQPGLHLDATEAGRPGSTLIEPASAEQAASAIRACLAAQPTHSVCVRGAGSKSALLPRADVTLSTAALAGIRTYAPADLYVTAGAGTALDGLQGELASDRMWLPVVSPWPGATLGGIVSANDNGPLRMRYGYGAIRDLLLAVEAVLPDGRIVRAGRPVVKNVAGYDLPKLFAGAQGTLGLLTAVTMRITPCPRARGSLVLPYDDLAAALAAGQALQRVCLAASALLLCHAVPCAGLTSPYAVVYTAEGAAGEVAAELAEARAVLGHGGAGSAHPIDGLSGSALWAEFVYAASAGGLALRAGLPARRLPGVLAAIEQALPEAPFVADLGNSLLFVGTRVDAGQLEAVRQPACAAGGYAVVVGATDPAAGKLDRWGYAPDSLDLMRKLKARWDPTGDFNPGAYLFS